MMPGSRPIAWNLIALVLIQLACAVVFFLVAAQRCSTPDPLAIPVTRSSFIQAGILDPTPAMAAEAEEVARMHGLYTRSKPREGYPDGITWVLAAAMVGYIALLVREGREKRD